MLGVPAFRPPVLCLSAIHPLLLRFVAKRNNVPEESRTSDGGFKPRAELLESRRGRAFYNPGLALCKPDAVSSLDLARRLFVTSLGAVLNPLAIELKLIPIHRACRSPSPTRSASTSSLGSWQMQPLPFLPALHVPPSSFVWPPPFRPASRLGADPHAMLPCFEGVPHEVTCSFQLSPKLAISRCTIVLNC